MSRHNPRHRALVAAPEDTEVAVWQERDRLHIRLYRIADDKDIIEWWDDDARGAIEDGFLDPRDIAGSAYEYAKELGLVEEPSAAAYDLPPEMRPWQATQLQRSEATRQRRLGRW